MNKKILISCPVCNRGWILPHYLEHIYNIDYDKKLIDIYWVVNNSTDSSLDLLKDFKEKYKLEYNNIIIDIYNGKKNFKDDRVTAIREKFTYDWLSELRNRILKKCYSNDYDYLFSCDSDILVPRDVLKSLLSHNKDYVAGLIYNGYLFTPPDEAKDYDPIINAYKYPNILKKVEGGYMHIVNYKVKNPTLNQKGTLIETDFTGAIFLASKDVCSIMKYAWHKQGEDCPASETAIKAGFKLYCDVSCYSQHMMNQKILDLYLKRELKFANGEIVKI